MSALRELIASMIQSEGPMPLETYMALALGHPRHGYYMTRDPFGARGDFVTSPEISQMFGELIGLWCADVWARMGRPKRVNLVELGPGRGTLMADALRAGRIVPGFHTALSVNMVETSPALRQAQQERLAQAGVSVEWRTQLDEVPPGPMLLIANEFFDALPARHYVRTPEGWRARVIGLDDHGAFAFGLASDVEPALTADAALGAILEINPAAQAIMREIAPRIARDGGAALVIDYGYDETQFGETLQAIRGHAFVDPVEEPGEADLTTHVDFSALARAARSAGCATDGPMEQGVFLTRLGIVERAAALARSAGMQRAASIHDALQRLTARDDAAGRGRGMGALFKVMAVTPAGAPIPAGFERTP